MPSRQTVTCSSSLSALTTLSPTPWSPPLTVYPDPSPPNLPPACSTVSTVSSADLPVPGWVAVGTPRPSSDTCTQPPTRSIWMRTVDAWPPCTSSIALSTISHTM